MICYKDKTFCKSDCINKECFRFLSEEDRDNAKRLNLPIALSDFTDGCAGYITQKNV